MTCWVAGLELGSSPEPGTVPAPALLTGLLNVRKSGSGAYFEIVLDPNLLVAP